MSSKYNPYQVICIGDDCQLYKSCGNTCILKDKFKKYLKGCNYSNEGDCKYCSHKNNCVLLKDYSEDLHKLEVKRNWLEKKNNELWDYVSEWDEIEKNLDKIDKVCDWDKSLKKLNLAKEKSNESKVKWEDVVEYKEVNSVIDIIHFPSEINTKQKMIDKINRNKMLINAYRKKEKELINTM